MAKQTLTLNKLKVNGGPVALNTTSNIAKSSAGQPFEVNSPDPSKLFFVIYHASSVKTNMIVSTTGATGARSGIGNASPLTKTTLTEKSSNTFLCGPFEASRFVDNSTGGKVIRLRFQSTAGSSDLVDDVNVSAFQVYDSTDGIISTT
jgi:hypothetical protein